MAFDKRIINVAILLTTEDSETRELLLTEKEKQHWLGVIKERYPQPLLVGEVLPDIEIVKP